MRTLSLDEAKPGSKSSSSAVSLSTLAQQPSKVAAKVTSGSTCYISWAIWVKTFDGISKSVTMAWMSSGASLMEVQKSDSFLMLWANCTATVKTAIPLAAVARPSAIVV